MIDRTTCRIGTFMGRDAGYGVVASIHIGGRIRLVVLTVGGGWNHHRHRQV
jgi:hypothetical protein